MWIDNYKYGRSTHNKVLKNQINNNSIHKYIITFIEGNMILLQTNSNSVPIVENSFHKNYIRLAKIKLKKPLYFPIQYRTEYGNKAKEKNAQNILFGL